MGQESFITRQQHGDEEGKTPADTAGTATEQTGTPVAQAAAESAIRKAERPDSRSSDGIQAHTEKKIQELLQGSYKSARPITQIMKEKKLHEDIESAMCQTVLETRKEKMSDLTYINKISNILMEKARKTQRINR